MSKLLSAADYRREIEELEAMITDARRMGELHGEDVLDRIRRENLEKRRDGLRAEMAERGDNRMPSQELEIVLTGRPVIGHEVDAGFLARVLDDMQKIVKAMVGAKRKGPHTKKVRDMATLTFAGSFAGSFGMRLESRNKQVDLEGESMLAPTFDLLMSVLSSDPRSPDLLERLAPLSPRARAEFRRLMDHISSEQAEIVVQWPRVQETMRARVRPDDARVLVGRLKTVVEEVRPRWYRGVLDGAIKRTGVFEFHTEDDQVIAGTVEPHLLDTLREFFDQPCQAFILTREILDTATGDRRTHHRLQELLTPGASIFSDE